MDDTLPVGVGWEGMTTARRALGRDMRSLAAALQWETKPIA